MTDLRDMNTTPDPTQVAKVKPQRKETENDRARKFGIPKWLKQYNARYGRGGTEGILACHLQNPAPMLDNGRDRANRGKA
mgnify:CR=1 FL=1